MALASWSTRLVPSLPGVEHMLGVFASWGGMERSLAVAQTFFVCQPASSFEAASPPFFFDCVVYVPGSMFKGTVSAVVKH